MQQNQVNDTLAQGFSNDGNIIDIEKRLFHEKDETTKRLHQTGFEEIMKFKSSFDSTQNKSLFKVFPLQQNQQTDDQNNRTTPFQQFQENLTRIYKGPCMTNDTHGCNGPNIHVPCSSGSINTSEKLIKNYNYDQNLCCSSDDNRPILKPILRNTVLRQDFDKMDPKRNVKFGSSPHPSNESRQIFPNLVAHCSTLPDQMDYAPTYSSNINQASPFSQKFNNNNNNNDNEAFKYHYLNMHSHRIPEEKPLVNCVNNPSPPPPNSYFPSGFNNQSYESQPYKYDCYPGSTTNTKINEISINNHQPYQNYVPDKMSPNSTISSYNQFCNQADKFQDDNNMQQNNEKFYFQPRTQERETIIFKRDGLNLQNFIPQAFSSQPCYAIPADAVYFHSDNFELYVNAKLLIPERLKMNILPEKIELYGCTEQISNNTTSLIEIMRVYDLPARIIPDQSCCFLSPDGILYLTSKWENPFR